MTILLVIIIFCLLLYVIYTVEKNDMEREELLNEVEIYMRMEQLKIQQALESSNIIAKNSFLKDIHVINKQKHKAILKYVRKYDRKEIDA